MVKRKFVKTSKSLKILWNCCRIPPNPDPNPSIQEEGVIQTTGATFQINNGKHYVSVVTLSVNGNIKFLENVKQDFKRKISWNKYNRFEIETKPQNSNLDYLIDQTLRNIKRLFVLLFKNGNDDPTKSSFGKYYMSLV